MRTVVMLAALWIVCPAAFALLTGVISWFILVVGVVGLLVNGWFKWQENRARRQRQKLGLCEPMRYKGTTLPGTKRNDTVNWEWPE